MFSDIQEIQQHRARNGSLVLMLSLFLIMLVFFVLLNALSRPAEEKQAAVIYGVQRMFDYRNDPLADDVIVARVGPAWFEDVDAKLRAFVTQAWPGAKIVASLETGSVEVMLALPDVRKDGVWSEVFLDMTKNLVAMLKAFPEVETRVLVEGGNMEDVGKGLRQFAEAVPGVTLGWDATVTGSGNVRLIVAGTPVLPAMAKQIAEVPALSPQKMEAVHHGQ